MKWKLGLRTALILMLLVVGVAAQVQATSPSEAQGNQPRPAKYRIEYFKADPTEIPAGGCTTLYYHVKGAAFISLSASNSASGPQRITDNPNSKVVCPSAANRYVPGQPVTYTLNVIYLNGRRDSRSVTVSFLPPTPTWIPTWTPTPVPTIGADYHIEYFTADQAVIPAGGCVTLYYWVVGAQTLTLTGSNWLSSGPQVITDNPNGVTICPSAADGYIPGQPVTYTLNVIYLDGRTDSASVVISFGPLDPTPTYPELSPTPVPPFDLSPTPVPPFDLSPTPIPPFDQSPTPVPYLEPTPTPIGVP